MSYISEYTGGLFWDILLLTKYNEDWENFFHSLIKVLPCQACIDKTINHHEREPLPKFKDNDEKNKYLWNLRLARGGTPWVNEVNEKGYTLESWEKLYEGKKFTRAGSGNDND